MSGQRDGIVYDVYSDVGCCSCYSGQQGGFCKHQAAVHIKFGKSFPNCPLLSADDKISLGIIATGEDFKMPPSFFAPMSETDTARGNVEAEATLTGHTAAVQITSNDGNQDVTASTSRPMGANVFDSKLLKDMFERLINMTESNKTDEGHLTGLKDQGSHPGSDE